MPGGEPNGQRIAADFVAETNIPMFGLDAAGVVRWVSEGASALFDEPLEGALLDDLVEFEPDVSWKTSGFVRLAPAGLSRAVFRWHSVEDAETGLWLGVLREPTPIGLTSERLRELYRDAPAILHSLGADRRFHVVSNRWLEAMHRARGEAEGASAFDIVAPSFRERARQIMGKVFKGLYLDGERVCLRDGRGHDRWFRVRSISLLDDEENFVQSLTYLESIEEELALGDAIAQERLKTHHVLEAVPWPFVRVTGRHMRVVRANDAFRELFGHTETLEKLFAPEDVDAVRRWIGSFAGTPVALAVQAHTVDEAARVMTLEARRLAPDTDDIAISFRETEDEDRQRDRLRANIEVLEQFTYIASHDLRAPVRAVRQLLEFFVEDIEETQGELPVEVAHYVAQLRSRIVRMGTLLDGLLAFSRAARHTKVSPVVCSLDEVAPLVWSDLLVSRGVAHGPLRLEVAPAPRIKIERSPFEECLTRVLDNCIAHADEKSRVVRISLGAPDAGTHQIIVEDDGPGIPPGEQERVFGLFRTIAPPADEVAGVGLSIARRIARSYGGNVVLERRVGARGTRVTIAWPQHDLTPPSNPGVVRPDLDPTKGRP